MAKIKYEIIEYKGTSGMVPAEVQISAEDIVKSDAQLNDPENGLPPWWPAGVLIHDPAYHVVKAKALDGSWAFIRGGN